MAIPAAALSSIRAKAADLDFTVERAIATDRIKLIDADGVAAMGPRNTPMFSVDEARRFLSRLEREREKG